MAEPDQQRRSCAPASGSYFLGTGFTAVDACRLFCYRQGNRIGLDMRQLFPRFSELAKTIAARPAVARILCTEGITLSGDCERFRPPANGPRWSDWAPRFEFQTETQSTARYKHLRVKSQNCQAGGEDAGR